MIGNKNLFVHGKSLFTSKESRCFGVTLSPQVVIAAVAVALGEAEEDLDRAKLAEVALAGGLRIQTDGRVYLEKDAQKAEQERLDKWRKENPEKAAAADAKREAARRR